MTGKYIFTGVILKIKLIFLESFFLIKVQNIVQKEFNVNLMCALTQPGRRPLQTARTISFAKRGHKGYF